MHFNIHCQIDLDTQLGKLYETLMACGDELNAQILDTLRVKLERQEVTVACYGYVSSGKSRLLNVLMKEDHFLPVSPLSSSRNVVYIRPGKSLDIELWPKEKPCTKGTMPGREQFHALCQDTGIERVELFWATPEGLSLMDTPGIDSIESGNQQAVNTALLLADLVIYVTD